MRARAVLEDSRFVVDEVEDRLEVVAAALDEAGGDLRPAVSVLGPEGRAGGKIDRVVPARALDPVLMVEAAVEPYRRVEGADLVHEVEGELRLEGLRVLDGGEVPALLLPGNAQRMGDPSHELLDRLLGARLVGDPRLAEVLAHGDVGGELGPALRHFRVVHLEDDLAVRAGDLGGAPGPLDLGEHLLRALSVPGVAAIDREAARGPRTDRGGHRLPVLMGNRSSGREMGSRSQRLRHRATSGDWTAALSASVRWESPCTTQEAAIGWMNVVLPPPARLVNNGRTRCWGPDSVISTIPGAMPTGCT